ncbi:uncharacterized protein [Aegilops tauschii subsp. strangulata]|uniref:uncharacterized protein n=1 Tax=Aegilops tauschii subsp. strangulata TaxID=200361 RepID=UPI00098B9F2F
MSMPPPPSPPPPHPGSGTGGAPRTPATPVTQPSNPALLTPSVFNRGALFVFDAGASTSTAPPPVSPLAGIFINQHVPIVLSLNPPNFSHWRTLFEVMFQKQAVGDHLSRPPRPQDPYWLQDDAHIVSWLYNRVTPEVFDLIHQRGATAAAVWSSICNLFLENAEHQVVVLSTEFRRIEQGGSSILSFFARLKDCADRLAELGATVNDRDQVLNMIRGLHPRFRYAVPILTMQTPFPSLLRCRAFLLLEESRLAADTTTDTALHAARAPANANNPGGPAATGQGGGANRGRGGGRRGRGRGNNSGGGTQAPRPTAPAPAPWTGMVHAWPMPWRPHAPGSGILGPCPGGAVPFAGSATHHATAPGTYNTAPPTAWYPAVPPHPLYNVAPAPAPPPSSSTSASDQSALIAALNNMTVQQQQPSPPSSDWYLDTGASSHMASSSGILSSANPCYSHRIVVGNGSSLAVTHTGHTTISTSHSPLHLNNILVSPHLIKNLLSVKALARGNPVNVEFDDLGFSFKDRRTRKVILRCNDAGDELYPMPYTPPTHAHHALTAVSRDLWHQRLGHPAVDSLDRTLRPSVITPEPSTTGVC